MPLPGVRGDDARLPRIPFSMTDEEGDLPAFLAYVRTLTPEALWDVQGHLEPDVYPRRYEAVRREIGRRGLFYLSPFTPDEERLRLLFAVWTLGGALCAALLAIHHIPIHLQPWEHLTFFYDLAAGGPAAAGIALPVAQDALWVVGVVTLFFWGRELVVRRGRLRPSLWGLGLGAAALGGLGLWWSTTT